MVLSKFLAHCKSMFSFSHSSGYWEQRYVSGGSSGDGSYGQLSLYKADFLNYFVAQNNVASIIELGCGDGNQTSLFNFNNYLGVDVSPKAIDLCKAANKDIEHFKFKHIDDHDFSEIYDCAISLDVIYHLVENSVFKAYMTNLFNSSRKYVLIYSSDVSKRNFLPHVRERNFSSWVEAHMPDWRLKCVVVNPLKPASISDFFVYARKDLQDQTVVTLNT